jgi:hypothetical protein
MKADVVLTESAEELPPFFPPSPGKPSTPDFIKPLHPLSLPLVGEDNNDFVLNDVIDLAKIADKDASSPPQLREQQ